MASRGTWVCFDELLDVRQEQVDRMGQSLLLVRYLSMGLESFVKVFI